MSVILAGEDLAGSTSGQEADKTSSAVDQTSLIPRRKRRCEYVPMLDEPPEGTHRGQKSGAANNGEYLCCTGCHKFQIKNEEHWQVSRFLRADRGNKPTIAWRRCRQCIVVQTAESLGRRSHEVHDRVKKRQKVTQKINKCAYREERRLIKVNRSHDLNLLEGQCALCLRSVGTLLIEWDHLDPTTKKYNLSAMGSLSPEEFIIEVKKCQPLCIECHNRKTFTLGDLQKWRETKHEAIFRHVIAAKKQCVACMKTCTEDAGSYPRFQFDLDHKTNLNRGDFWADTNCPCKRRHGFDRISVECKKSPSLDDWKKEIDERCQVLCCFCHAYKTYVEHIGRHEQSRHEQITSSICRPGFLKWFRETYEDDATMTACIDSVSPPAAT
jgi:hypothetical protein